MQRRRFDVQYLLDFAAIRDVIARYFQGIDRGDLGQVRDCFTADVRADYHQWEPVAGIDTLMGRIESILLGDSGPQVLLRTHFMGNLNIDRLEGNSAGFIIGIWADGFEKLQIIPLLIVTPLTFLGGSFYSIDMLPPVWRTISLFNPVVYLISGFRWSFHGTSDVSIGISLAMTLAFLAVFLAIVAWIFRTGYRLKT